MSKINEIAGIGGSSLVEDEQGNPFDRYICPSLTDYQAAMSKFSQESGESFLPDTEVLAGEESARSSCSARRNDSFSPLG